MPALPNARHEAFAQAPARGLSIAAAYAEAGYKPNRGNAHTLLKQNKCISKRVDRSGLGEEDLATAIARLGSWDPAAKLRQPQRPRDRPPPTGRGGQRGDMVRLERVRRGTVLR